MSGLPRLGAEDLDVTTAGGKAAALHALVLAGFRVPPGFVVTPDVDLDAVADDDLSDLVAGIGGFPVAVRSSGVLEDLEDASFAGQYETYLDVTDLAGLRERVADCRRSGQTDRVRAYLTDRGFDADGAPVAVLVQRLVPARTAGVGFSLDPITGMEEHGVVECCAGLGDRLVSGTVRPTRLVIHLREATVVERADGEEDVVLGADEAADLARLLVAVQAHGHRPQDIEWAIDVDGAIWLLQARPITAIAWRTDVDQLSDADLRDGGVSARVCTPMMFSLYHRAFQPTMQAYFEELRLLAPGVVEDWMVMHYGRAYWNASAVKRCLARVPGFDESHVDRDLGVQKDYGRDGPIRTPTTVAGVVRAIPTAIALERLYRRQLAAVEAFSRTWPAIHDTWKERAARLEVVDDDTFVAVLAECLRSFHTTTECAYFTTIYNNANAQSDFKKMLDKLDAATAATTSVIDLMGGLEDISHMGLQRGIRDLHATAVSEGFDGPAWKAALGRFLDHHGFHADMELELTCPRWSEEPERVTAMVAGMIDAGTPPADPDARAGIQRSRYEAEVDAVRRRIRSAPLTRFRFGWTLDRHLRRVRRYLVARERMREYSSQVYAVVRAHVVCAGSRLAADGRLADPDDVFMLTVDELVGLAQRSSADESLLETVRFRRAMYDGYRDVQPPHELGGGVTQVAAATAGDEHTLVGLGCSAGTVEGTARVVMSLDEIGTLREGDVLVSRFTDPGWTPALGLVAGVVTEVGGMLSHAAVIGREYGIPAVLNVPGATETLRSGQRIRVDGSAGTVEVVSEAREPEPIGTGG